MRQTETQKPAHVSPSHDFFHLLFEGADMVSSFWQPMLKSVGRWHLEVAGLGMRQGQAAIQYGHDIAHSFSPVDVYAAQVRYWDRIATQFHQSRDRLVSSSVQHAPAAVQTLIRSDVVPLQIKRTHDVIELPDGDANALADRAA